MVLIQKGKYKGKYLELRKLLKKNIKSKKMTVGKGKYAR